MIMYPPSPRFSSNRPAVVPERMGATTSMKSPPSGTTTSSALSIIHPRIPDAWSWIVTVPESLTNEVPQPKLLHARILVYDFRAYDMSLPYHMDLAKATTIEIFGLNVQLLTAGDVPVLASPFQGPRLLARFVAASLVLVLEELHVWLDWTLCN